MLNVIFINNRKFIFAMYPQTHFLFPFLIGLVLTKFNFLDWKLALVCGFLAVVIDMDHFIEHIIHKKKNKFSLSDTWNNAIHYHDFTEWSFLHHWQGMLLMALILLGVVFFSWKWVLVLGIAYYSHMLLDHIAIRRKPKRFQFKLFELFIEIPYYEIVFDVVLVIGIIIVWFY